MSNNCIPGTSSQAEIGSRPTRAARAAAVCFAALLGLSGPLVLAGCGSIETEDVTNALMSALAPGDSHAGNFDSSSAGTPNSLGTSSSNVTTTPVTTPVQTPESDQATDEAQTEPEATEPEATQDQNTGPDGVADDLNAHNVGDSVTVSGASLAYDVYATWMLDDDGEWTAYFYTDNGSILYAYPSGQDWVFYSGSGDRVVCNQEGSSAYGQVGPAGTNSHWQSVSDPSTWY